MVGINWDNIHVGVTGITNEIVLLKGKKKIDNGKAYLFATDKSDERTQEVMDAAIQYLLNLVQRSGGPERKAIIECEGMYRLTFGPEKKAIIEHEGLYRLTFEDLREAGA